MNKRFFGLMVLIILVSVPSSISPYARASNLDRVSIKLDWKHGVQFLGLIIAREKGYFEKEGLNVSIIPSATVQEISENPTQVVSGKYQFAIGSGSLIAAQNHNVPIFTIASIYQLSPSVLFALEESGIRSIRDLKGRSIVVKGDAWLKLLIDFFNMVDMKLTDMKEIPRGFDITPFYQRKVDIWTGFITSEVAISRLKGYKLVTFPMYEYGFESLGASIYASRKFVARNFNLVHRFIRASINGWVWAVNNPTKAVEVFHEVMPEKKVEAEINFASFNATIPLVRPPGVQIGSIDCQKYIINLSVHVDNSEDYCTQRFTNNLRAED